MNSQLQNSLQMFLESAIRLLDKVSHLVDLATKKLEQEEKEQEDSNE